MKKILQWRKTSKLTWTTMFTKSMPLKIIIMLASQQHFTILHLSQILYTFRSKVCNGYHSSNLAVKWQSMSSQKCLKVQMNIYFERIGIALSTQCYSPVNDPVDAVLHVNKSQDAKYPIGQIVQHHYSSSLLFIIATIDSKDAQVV